MHSLTFSGRSFRPSLALTIAGLAVVATLVSLGYWQHQRALEKEALAQRFEERMRGPMVSLPSAQVDADSMQYRRVAVRGEYVPALTILLDNRVHQGAAGYRVLTPLRIQGSDWHVLIDRGWIAGGASRDQLPAIQTPAGTQVVEGVAVVPSARFLELAPDAASGPVRQNLVIGRLEQELRIRIEPVVVEQTSSSTDGLVRELERPDTGAERSRAYSLQWYAMALVALVFYVLLGFRSGAPRSGA